MVLELLQEIKENEAHKRYRPFADSQGLQIQEYSKLEQPKVRSFKIVNSYTRSSAPKGEICGVSISIADEDFTERVSVCKITDTRLFNKNEPRLNSLTDPRMGPIDFNSKCVTCGGTLASGTCNGHFGHFEFFRRVYLPSFMPEIHQSLLCCCYKCGRVLLRPTDPQYHVIMKIKNAAKRRTKLVKACTSIEYCGGPPPPVTITSSPNNPADPVKPSFDAELYLNQMGKYSGCHALQPVYIRTKKDPLTIRCFTRIPLEKKRNAGKKSSRNALLSDSTNAASRRGKKKRGEDEEDYFDVDDAEVDPDIEWTQPEEEDEGQVEGNEDEEPEEFEELDELSVIDPDDNEPDETEGIYVGSAEPGEANENDKEEEGGEDEEDEEVENNHEDPEADEIIVPGLHLGQQYDEDDEEEEELDNQQVKLNDDNTQNHQYDENMDIDRTSDSSDTSDMSDSSGDWDRRNLKLNLHRSSRLNNNNNDEEIIEGQKSGPSNDNDDLPMERVAIHAKKSVSFVESEQEEDSRAATETMTVSMTQSMTDMAETTAPAPMDINSLDFNLPGFGPIPFGSLATFKKKKLLRKDVKGLPELGVEQNFTADHAYGIFRRIPESDYYILGFVHYSKPYFMCPKKFPVLPPPMRLSVSSKSADGTKGRGDADFTKHLNHMLTHSTDAEHYYQIILDKYQRNEPYHKEYRQMLVALDNLQISLAEYICRDEAGVPATSNGHAKIALKCITDMWVSKSGKVRGYLNAKRVDYSARTVVVSGPDLNVNEIGVPIHICMKVTKPVTVSKYNIHKLQEYVDNGPDRYPGAKFIIKSDGLMIDLRYARGARKMLVIGDRVERHLCDDDIVLINRQPTLHRPSVMAHRVKVHPWLSFRLHLYATSPYNADFDGDEMNLHVPQTQESEAEACELCGVNTQIVGVQDRCIIGAKQDSLIAAHLITAKHRLYDETYLLTTLPRIRYWSGWMGDNNDPYSHLPIPALMYRDPNDPTGKTWIKKWTGKQIFSLPFPKTVYYQPESSDVESWFKDSSLLMRFGELLFGRPTGKSLAATRNSIWHHMFHDCGPDVTGTTMSDFNRDMNPALYEEGFSCGIIDNRRTAETKGNIAHILSHTIESLSRPENQSLSESNIILVVNKAREQAGCMVMIQHKASRSNGDAEMVESEAKGSRVHIAQANCLLGQILCQGKRMPLSYLDRHLPHIKPNDPSPTARGFVVSPLITGLNPIEEFDTCKAGREGLTDTTCKIPDIGYMQRCMNKGMEDESVKWDGTIRSLDDISAFSYGDGGFDASRLETQLYVPIQYDVHKLVEEYDGRVRFAQCAQTHPKQAELSVALDEEFNTILSDIGRMRKHKLILDNVANISAIDVDVSKAKFAKEFKAPVHFARLIELSKLQFVQQQGQAPQEESLMDPLFTYARVKEVIKQCETIQTAYTPMLAFLALLRLNLCVVNLICHHQLTLRQFHWLCDQVVIRFRAALINANEMVGGVAAQSIGEPSSQMTLNSVDWKQEIVIRYRLASGEYQVQVGSIGQWIDSLIEMKPVGSRLETFPNDTLWLGLQQCSDSHLSSLQTLSVDENGYISWENLEAVTRHLPLKTSGERDRLLRVELESGKVVVATRNESFLIRTNNNKIVPIRGSELTVNDDLLPVIEADAYLKPVLSQNLVYERIVKISEVESSHRHVYDFTVARTRNFILKNGVAIRDSFHAASGASSQDNHMAIPRMQELVRFSKNCVYPIMTAPILPEYQDRPECIAYIKKQLECLLLPSFLIRSDVILEPNLKICHPDFKQDQWLVSLYQLTFLSDETVNFTDYVIRFEFNREKCIRYHKSIEVFHGLLQDQLSGKSHIWMCSPANASQWIIRLRIRRVNTNSSDYEKYKRRKFAGTTTNVVKSNNSQSNGYVTMDRTLDADVPASNTVAENSSLIGTSSSGSSSIVALGTPSNASSSVPLQSISQSTLGVIVDEKRIMNRIHQALLTTNANGIDKLKDITVQNLCEWRWDPQTLAMRQCIFKVFSVVGTNFQKLANIQGIDFRRIRIKDSAGVEEMLDVDAARMSIFREMKKVFLFNGSYCNDSHVLEMSRFMSRDSQVKGITRRAVDEDDRCGFLKQISFEKIVKIIFGSAAKGTRDNGRPVTSKIMLGQRPLIGANIPVKYNLDTVFPTPESRQEFEQLRRSNLKTLDRRLLGPVSAVDEVQMLTASSTMLKHIVDYFPSQTYKHQQYNLKLGSMISEDVIPNYDHLRIDSSLIQGLQNAAAIHPSQPSQGNEKDVEMRDLAVQSVPEQTVVASSKPRPRKPRLAPPESMVLDNSIATSVLQTQATISQALPQLPFFLPETYQGYNYTPFERELLDHVKVERRQIIESYLDQSWKLYFQPPASANATAHVQSWTVNNRATTLQTPQNLIKMMLK